jgi:hypothetical protein
MILWPKNGWQRLDPAALAADLVGLGLTGAIPQCSDEAPTWVHTHGQALADAGLQLTAGLGRVTAPAILAALHEPLCSGALLDEEDWRKVDDAAALTTAVLNVCPDAPARVADCMYPYVTVTRGGSNTGHAAITRAFYALCQGHRYPQCYWEPVPGSGQTCAPDGFVARCLADARSDREWPSIGVPADQVQPCVQAYHRSVTDHVRLFQQEPTVILWDYCEMDASCRVALLLFKASPHVDVATLGPELAQQLGVPVPAGVVWRHPAS